MGIVIDYNKMSINELLKLHRVMRVNFVVENGVITDVENDKKELQ